jgi:hypothetical protein
VYSYREKPASAAAERICSETPEQSSNRKRNVAAPKVYKIKIGNKNVNRYDKLIRQNPSNPLNLRSFYNPPKPSNQNPSNQKKSA